MTASRQRARRVPTGVADAGARVLDGHTPVLHGVARAADPDTPVDIDREARVLPAPAARRAVDRAAPSCSKEAGRQSPRARDRARAAHAFDRKFGSSFLRSVPAEPGVYRFYDDGGALIYVGKAGDLRRRLAQYRATRRTRVDRKRRALVEATASIVWDVCGSEHAAALREVRLIQALRPRANVASAFPFLYPYVGLRIDGNETYFCLTTSPESFAAFDLHGAFRSRDVTGAAFFALRRLLALVGHPIPPARCRRLGAARYSHVFGLRRLPADWAVLWRRFLMGASREAVECLSLRLVEHAGARARRAEVKVALRAIARFFDDEAVELARALSVTGYSSYPLPQRHRDRIFLRYRRTPDAVTKP